MEPTYVLAGDRHTFYIGRGVNKNVDIEVNAHDAFLE